MEHKTKAVEVSFLKKTKWTGTATRMLTFPVVELADRCLNAWLDITDEGFSHAILPSAQLAERFSTLMESDADQAVWDEFYKAVGEEFSRLSVDELAAFFHRPERPFDHRGRAVERRRTRVFGFRLRIPVLTKRIHDDENQSQGTASHPHYS